MSQPIHHTFAPLGDRTQRMTALRFSYFPWKYKRGPETETLRSELQKKFGGDVSLFASGRDGLLALLRTLKKTDEDEVIVQGYTCVVLPNAIHAAGMKTVYADIQKRDLNFDIASVKAAITPRTRAIICQHTFGIPGPLAELRALCDEHRVVLIEDCAHIIPDASGPDIGMTGDFVMLSFGRDKAISGVTGGALISRNPEVSKHLQQMEHDAGDLSFWTITRLLEYPQIYGFARPLYGLGIGKLKLWFAAKLVLLIPILTASEKAGHAPLLHRIPNACAALALEQLRRLQSLNDHRRMLTECYLKACAECGWPVLHGISGTLPLQKFPIFVKNARMIRNNLKKFNIHLEDGWTGCVVCPATVEMNETGYQKGMDPAAESVCEEILSLPTHPTMTLKQAKKLVSVLQRAL